MPNITVSPTIDTFLKTSSKLAAAQAIDAHFGVSVLINEPISIVETIRTTIFTLATPLSGVYEVSGTLIIQTGNNSVPHFPNDNQTSTIGISGMAEYPTNNLFGSDLSDNGALDWRYAINNYDFFNRIQYDGSGNNSFIPVCFDGSAKPMFFKNLVRFNNFTTYTLKQSNTFVTSVEKGSYFKFTKIA